MKRYRMRGDNKKYKEMEIFMKIKIQHNQKYLNQIGKVTERGKLTNTEDILRIFNANRFG